jgi:hypothetical protein
MPQFPLLPTYPASTGHPPLPACPTPPSMPTHYRVTESLNPLHAVPLVVVTLLGLDVMARYLARRVVNAYQGYVGPADTPAPGLFAQPGSNPRERP